MTRTRRMAINDRTEPRLEGVRHLRPPFWRTLSLGMRRVRLKSDPRVSRVLKVIPNVARPKRESHVKSGEPRGATLDSPARWTKV